MNRSKSAPAIRMYQCKAVTERPVTIAGAEVVAGMLPGFCETIMEVPRFQSEYLLNNFQQMHVRCICFKHIRRGFPASRGDIHNLARQSSQHTPAFFGKMLGKTRGVADVAPSISP